MAAIGSHSVVSDGKTFSVTAIPSALRAQCEQSAIDAGTWAASGPGRYYRPTVLANCVSGRGVNTLRLTELQKTELHALACRLTDEP